MSKELLGNIEMNKIYHMDCLEGMELIPDNTIDMILCDLPYGTTHCKWDTIIPFADLWNNYERIIKDDGAIVLTASQPFTSALIMSNPKLFKCEWIYQKTMMVNPAQVKRYPAKKHENIVVFCKTTPKYYPQMEEGKRYEDNRKTEREKTGVFGEGKKVRVPIKNDGTRYPSSVQIFKNSNHKSLHPTQKPVALFEYLINTYTKEGDIVLDNCMGSGTTAIASSNLNRRWIGFENELKYVEIANKRIEHILSEKNIT